MRSYRAALLAGVVAAFLFMAPAAQAQFNDHVADAAGAANACMDLPALRYGTDCEARVNAGDPACIGVPAVNICGPRGAVHEHAPAAAPTRLPVTGVNVGDLLALGLAALSSGGLLLRRLRMSVGA